jgi:hypothetical protein
MLSFGGLDWTFRADGGGPSGPGNNYFDGTGPYIDSKGRLHLTIAKNNFGGKDFSKDKWNCSEVLTTKKLGCGKVSGVIDMVKVEGKQVPLTSIDKHVVIGIFGYPTSDLGPDATHEFDIEFSYWGQNDKDGRRPDFFIQLSNWATQLTPNKSTQMWRGKDFNSCFDLSQMNPIGFSIERHPGFIEWRIWDTITGAALGHRETGLSDTQLSKSPMPFHLNLWLKDGEPSGPIDVTFSKFEFSV